MQNIIAIVWDFDKTLVDGYMQQPIFEDYNVDSKEFWRRVNDMPSKYAEQGTRVNPDTAYLIEFTRKAKDGTFKGLNNAKLREYGKRQKFYPGIPEFIKETKEFLSDMAECQEYNIKVENYIVSTGFAEVIKGSELNEYVEGIWGCELIEDKDKDGNLVISDVCYMIDNTTKTRALFEINKGVNRKKDINVNTKMDDGKRRVSFQNMIYIADGPSDVPAFSVVKKNGGVPFAIFPKGDSKAIQQVEQLREDGRIDYFSEADYRKDSTTYLWIKNKVRSMASRIIQQEKNNQAVIDHSPRHLSD